MKPHTLSLTIALAIILFSAQHSLAILPPPPTIIYVDADATGVNNGSSWRDAYNFLQDALAAATTGDQILVAQGIYKPDKGQGITPGDRSASFHLTNGITIKGGYAGFGAPNPDARDIERFRTILSGDLAGNDIEVADPTELISEPTRSENSCNVVNATGCDRTTLLEGLTITAGNANFVILGGGGILNGKPTVSQCRIVANTASTGGGIYFEHSAHCQGALLKDSIISHNAANTGGGVYNCAEVVNCTFTGNAADDGYAGALYLGSDCETTVTDCTFNRNYAAGSAGAVYLGYSGTEVTFTRCLFIANSTYDKGGAIYSDGCTCGSYPTFYQCKFIANTARSDGGAICNYGFSDTQLLSCLLVGNSSGGNGGALCDEYDAGSSLINCTVTNNTATGQGGAICYDNYSYKSRRLANTIIWANSDKNGQTHQYSQIYFKDVSEVEDVTNCCIQVIPPEIEGRGNITSNPLFVDIDGPDNIPGNEDDNLHLLEGSGCIDTGHNEYVPVQLTDLDGKRRIINGTVDRGAYEYGPEPPRIIYVDDSATGADNGTSWKDAFKYLQTGILAASSGYEIRVAGGIYKPNVGAIDDDTPDERTLTFQLKNGVTIKGGYAGLGHPDPDARDIERFRTILSGDLAGNDININDPENLGREPTRGENSYRVVTGSGTDATAILDGFTITGGFANYYDFSQCNGAGMFNDRGSPTVLNCTFIANFAGNDDGGGLGGGMYNYNGSPTLTNCRFIQNCAIALDGGEGAGGAMGNWLSSPTLTNCIFTGNIAGRDGGGMWSYESNPVLVNCLFSGNLAREGGSGSYGGGMWSYDGSASLINCTFAGNTARSSQIGQAGGGLYAEYLTELTLTNCIFWGNTSDGVSEELAQICIRNGPVNINYCCVQGWTGQLGGVGNIGDNPLFVDSGHGDCHLQPDSPCIDTGDNSAVPPSVTTDLDGNPRIMGGAVDMGAYELKLLRIIYVDDSATGANNGSSWADAFNYLQDALTVAVSGCEISVAQGAYKPDEGVGKIRGDRTATFQLKNSITIKGGYAGFGKPAPNARDFVAYETILSGDIGTVADFSDNSYHVVQGGDNAILEGFTVVGGNANGLFQGGYGVGGGLYNDNCRLVVANCTFEENAAFNGGAIFSAGGTLAVYESMFVANLASQGGALVNLNGHMTLTRCVMRNNAEGTIFCFGNGALQVESCVFDNNYGGWHAIDRSNTGNVIEVINSLFTHNAGGAINSSYNSLLIVNSTLVDNHTTTFGGGVCCSYGSLSAANCIMWGNTAGWDGDEIFGADASITVSYSCIAGGYPGTGNINMNPLFCAPASEDYHLQPGSPCIDAGDNSAIPPSVTTDLDDAPRIMGKAVDMGAYELKPLRIIYVDDTARGANDGSSWTDAYKFLQDALATATNGCEIRIGQGIYKPDQFVLSDRPNRGRLETFQLKNGVILKGGYAGFGAPNPDARDIEKFRTILSGDLNGNDRNTVEPYNLPREPSRIDNSIHVVTASGTNKTAVLDGVTITAGHANNYIDDHINGQRGGGIYNRNGSPTIRHCTFLANSAFGYEDGIGGGLYNEYGSPTLINCKFVRNAVGTAIPDHGAGKGGAIGEDHSNPKLIDCVFIANVAAGNHGGAIYHCDGSPELKGCTFRENSAQKYGGGLCNWWGKVKLSGCAFIGNTAGSDAGGMYNCGNSSLSNCEFVGNKCRQNGGGFSSDGLNPTIDNCRFTENSSGNAGGAIANRVSSPNITNCTFTGNTAGSGGGGGIYNRENANPTISDCTFTRNRALLDYGGGGMCNNASSPVVSNCTFTQNKADDNGGAVSNWYASSPTFTNCLFVENAARTCGGLHSYENCNPTVIDCKFIRNATGSFGGAMSIGVNCNATVINCLFAQNLAGTHAGGLSSYSSNSTLINCTFAANSAPRGSALSFTSATNLPVNDTKLSNCILWDRGSEIWKGDDSTIAITYSDVQGGWPGTGNINADPLFADPCDGNYHLRPYSPCINKGDNSAVPPSITTDLDGNERIMFRTVDMGAYEFQGPMIIFVDDDATGVNDGSSWKDAYKFLQDALTIASKGCEIRVAQGTYKPDQTTSLIPSSGRTATFRLKNGLVIKGGYAGVTEPRPDVRDVNTYESILSGDLLGNDASASPIDPTLDNSLHVVTGSETNSTAILDGFTITAGNANQVNPYLSPYAHGGGMFNEGGSPTVANCTFIANSAAYFGAGICNWQSSNPTLTNCTFADNWADNRGGGVYNWSSRPRLTGCTFSNNRARILGGGLYGEGDSDATITDCTFTGNWTDETGGGGGAICNNNSDTIIANCIFTNNTGKNLGGAIENQTWSRPVIVNCLFVGNKAGVFGGTIDNCNETRPSIINCTFAGNLAPAGRAVGCYGEPPTGPSGVQITNCILRDGGDEIAVNDNSTITVTYSDIQKGWPGEGNIDADPLFADPCDGNYRLRPHSPCINAGDNSALPPSIKTDLDGRPRIIGRAVDMGAYEFNHRPVANAGPDRTVYAGLDGKAKVTLDGTGSFDEDGQPLGYRWTWRIDGREFVTTGGDGIINMLDFALLAKKWLQDENLFADSEPFARDGRIGVLDLSLITEAWLSTPDSPNWNPHLDIAPAGPTPTIILPVGRHVIQLVVNDGIDDSEPDWVIITVLGPLQAELVVYPEVIERTNPWPVVIMTMLYLPPEVTPDQVDADRPLLLYPGHIETLGQYIFQTDRNGAIVTAIFAVFDKDRLLRAVPENGPVRLDVVGRLKTGRFFCGSDTVMIID